MAIRQHGARVLGSLMRSARPVSHAPLRLQLRFGATAAPPLSYDKLRQTWENHTRSLYTFFDEPLLIVEARRAVLTDYQGREYIDFYNNVHQIGHSDARVAEAVYAQMLKSSLSTRFLSEVTPRYIDALISKMPESPTGKGWSVFLVNSGSEANDLAMQIARDYTGRQRIVAIENCYHGITSAINEINSSSSTGISASKGSDASAFSRTAVVPMPWTLEEGVASSKAVLDGDGTAESAPAAFIAETVQGVGGNVDWPDEYLKEVFDHVQQLGGITIADEVQTGFGRCGTFWGFERDGVIPDIVTMGKPIGNGFPLGAVVCRTELAEAIEDAKLFSTFGGNPPAAAAGLAVMAAIEEDNLVARAASMGAFLRSGLESLCDEHPHVFERVTGRGLFLGLHLRVPSAAKKHPHMPAILQECLDHGIVLGKGGIHSHVLRFKPPLCIEEDQIYRCLQVVRDVCVKLA